MYFVRIRSKYFYYTTLAYCQQPTTTNDKRQTTKRSTRNNVEQRSSSSHQEEGSHTHHCFEVLKGTSFLKELNKFHSIIIIISGLYLWLQNIFAVSLLRWKTSSLPESTRLCKLWSTLTGRFRNAMTAFRLGIITHTPKSFHTQSEKNVLAIMSTYTRTLN